MLKFDRQGLLPVVVTAMMATDEVLMMVAFLNQIAQERTRETGHTHPLNVRANAHGEHRQYTSGQCHLNCEENSSAPACVSRLPVMMYTVAATIAAFKS